MRLHHIGYITDSIEETAENFRILGYVSQPKFDDTVQQCFISFLKKEGDDILIELVQPYETNASMQKVLKKGVSTYHICYEVDDVQAVYDELSGKEGWFPIFAPVAAVAMGNRSIVYFLNAAAGFIEFVNSK